ncbi:MAG: hypothetical protein JWR12_2997 [Mucilaginibacter sp.]|nr:hypothetical protein [Mucilaginibacter sp.]
MRKSVKLLLLLPFISACCSQKLTQRYAKLIAPAVKNDTVTTGIEVYASARDAPAAAPVANQYVLTDHGQAAYISAVAQKAKDLDELQANIFPDVSGLDKGPSSVDNTVFTKRLLMTVLSHTPYEADRITKLSIRIGLNTSVSGLKILTFDKITTEYQTIDLGTINQANAFTAGATASYGLTNTGTSSTAGGTTTNTVTNPDGSVVATTNPVTTTGTSVSPTFGAGLSATYSNTTTEQVDLKNRYIALTGYIKNDSLVFDEESVTGVNLTGNIVSDIKFKFVNRAPTRTYSVSNLSKNGKQLGPDAIKIKVLPVLEASLPGELKLPVTYTITVRHVINPAGRKTVAESDDEISYFTVSKSTTTDLTLVNKEELTVKKWYIAADTNSLNIVDSITGDGGVMFFTSYDNAISFFKWLKRTPLDKTGGLTAGDYKFVGALGDLKKVIETGTVHLFN